MTYDTWKSTDPTPLGDRCACPGCPDERTATSNYCSRDCRVETEGPDSCDNEHCDDAPDGAREGFTE